MERGRERRTHYSDLGVPFGAGRKELESALWRWQRISPRGEEEREALGRAERAYLVLSDPCSRMDYDRRLGEMTHPAWSESASRAAEASFERCLKYMRRGQGAKALKKARRSHSLDPARPLYRSFLALLLAREGFPLREAMRHGRLAHEQDPDDRRIALNLAEICEMAGLRKRSDRLRRRWGAGFLGFLLPWRPRRR